MSADSKRSAASARSRSARPTSPRTEATPALISWARAPAQGVCCRSRRRADFSARRKQRLGIGRDRRHGHRTAPRMLDHVGVHLLDPQQERRLQERLRFRDPPPGTGRIAGVRVDIKVPIIKIEMLDVKALMRPLSQRLTGEPPRALDVVLSQPDDGPDEGAGRGDHVTVAALARLVEDLLAAARGARPGDPGRTATRGRRSGRCRAPR